MNTSNFGIGGSGGSGGSVPVPPPLRPIPAQIQRLATLLTELDGQVGNLEDRLFPVLDHAKPVGPNQTGLASKNDDARPKVDNELCNLNNRLEHLVQVLADLRDRARL